MILNKYNEIDNQISKIFSKAAIENINKDSVDYLGININPNMKDNFYFKIYSQNRIHDYSQYSNDYLINYMAQKNMLRFLTMVQDKNNNNFSRYDIGLNQLEDSEYEELFEWLSKNVTIFNKNKDEIIKLSKMKRNPNKKYSSFHFIGFVKENEEIKLLKCHWINKIRKGSSVYKNSYYLNFLKRKNIPAFNELIPYAKSAIRNCKGHIMMEGIDYNENTQEKYKIYVRCYGSAKTYSGLTKTFENNQEMTRKINMIQEWNNIHKEFYCDGFAICKDIYNNLNLNLYFRLYK